MKILVIDDDRTIKLLISRCLTKKGHEVFLADDGEHGLAMAPQIAPDLILLDVMMPGISGLEVCAKLKQDKSTKLIPIFMLTGKSQQQNIDEALSAGASNYISKPFNPLQIAEVIDTKYNEL